MAPTEATNLLKDADPLLTGRQDSYTPLNRAADDSLANSEHSSGRNRRAEWHISTGASPSAQQTQQTPKHSPTPEYDPDDHFRILFQIYGSVWPQVLPWCLAIMVFTAAVFWLRDADILDLTISNAVGHNFMSLLVSFLIVTRATVVYGRFMAARQHLADLFRASREIVSHACLLTACNTNPEAEEWRRQTAYKTILLLRVATAAMQYRSHGVTAWETLPDEEHAETPLFLRSDSIDQASLRRYKWSSKSTLTTTTPDKNGNAGAVDDDDDDDVLMEELHSLMHGPRTAVDENFRAPFVLALNLRQYVLSTRPKRDQEEEENGTFPKRPLTAVEELKILSFVTDMTTAYNDAKRLITTPFPFPLVQMCYTFTLFWVWSLPLVLIGDNDQKAEVFLLLFFLSYGFLGLEYVNRELDDPYGNDPNDFCVNRWEAMVQEDIYICLLKTDGHTSAQKLRRDIDERISHGNALDNYREDIRHGSFWHKSYQNLAAAMSPSSWRGSTSVSSPVFAV